MSEAENIDTEEAVETPEVKEAPKPSRADYDRIQAEKASRSGWKDFDDYIADGGDPSKWKTADAFNTYGELIGTVKRKEQEFEQRIDGVQKLAQVQLAAQREELLAKRDNAIEMGQKAEVHAIERQLNNLNQAPPMPQLIPGIEELNDWNARNAWVTEKTPKAAFARELWTQMRANNTPIPQALAVLEEEVSKHYPKARRQTTIPEGEKGHGSVGFGNKTRSLTMSDLNDEEKLAWKHMPHAWGNDEKKFLQAAADMRKATQGGK